MNPTFPIPLLAVAALMAGAFPARADTYVIGAAHSSVGFAIRHDVFFKLEAGFTRFHGTVTVDRDRPQDASVEASIEVASLDTHIRARDSDLKSPHYFDAAKYPLITFKSKAWRQTGENAFEVKGDLTIKDVTKEVVLAVKFLGESDGAASWQASGTLNRKDFGVSGPSVLDKGIRDEVEVAIAVRAVKQ